MKEGRRSLLKDSNDLCEEPEPSLVEMFHDLMIIAEKITNQVKVSVNEEIANKSLRAQEEEEEESDDSADDDSVIGDEDSNSENEEEEKKTKKKDKTVELTDLENLLEVLQLHRQQKQHLLIKRAILLKFEEKLFGNNNITMTIDLRQLGEEAKDGKLERILKCRDLSRYLPKQVTENGNVLQLAEKAEMREIVSSAQCPPDILSRLKSKTPKSVAVNLILQQYNIRWNTSSGESKPFEFYSLPKHFMKGSVRRAHLQTVLYEHKNAIANLHAIFNLDQQTPLQLHCFCPAVAYVKKDPYAKPGDEDTGLPIRSRDEPKYSWQSWSFNNPEPQTSTSKDLGFEFPPDIAWISPKVKTLIKKLCEPIPDDFNPETTPNVMYMLVISETLPVKLQEPAMRSQVYIGGADQGIKDRFLGDEGHCLKMINLFNHFSDIQYFVPHPSALLIEMRLLLALARRERHALFVLKVCDSPRTLGREVHDVIVQAMWLAKDEIWGPAVDMRFGLNMKEELKKKRRFLPDSFPGSNRRSKRTRK